MMEEPKYIRLWQTLNSELAKVRDISNTKPLLVHYTSIHVIESILRNAVLWLSNPLLMNDHQEVSYGIIVALEEAQNSRSLRRSFANEQAYQSFLMTLRSLFHEYGNHEVKNLFVACFSEHDPSELPDGKLSMWRGYGDYGNGAAITFDTSKMPAKEQTPIILSEVEYLTNEDRHSRIRAKVAELAEFVAEEGVSEEEASAVAHAYFRRAAIAAIFTKHIGFKEEREWRLAYVPDRDPNKDFLEYVDYFQGARGLEPKLKLPLKGNVGMIGWNLSFEEFVHSIIIGPRAATPLSKHAAEIMLRKTGNGQLSDRLLASSIPFRD